ncbi:unnamed protein product [Porites lobata]|uniref:Uncharacterized protein n=1 Tax=Porites lobata TaxID=104759 RepID=A0ABN8P9Z6_9CNID|nr:unnamed protein product [Porites lobata]
MEMIFSQLAKQSSRVLPAVLCTDVAHCIINQRICDCLITKTVAIKNSPKTVKLFQKYLTFHWVIKAAVTVKSKHLRSTMQYCAVKPPGLQNSTQCSKTKGATFTPSSSTSSIFMPDEDTNSC